MEINKIVKEILRNGKTRVPKREILKLVKEKQAELIEKKTRENMKPKVKKETFWDKVWRWVK